MKKLLLASTALVMTAGVASAQVALSGDGRMGIVYDGAADSDSRLSFTSRARVVFTLSGETDGGLAFGGSFRADNASGAASGTAGSVFVAGEFGRLTMGDVDSAFGATFGDISGVGLTGLGDLHELSHSADGGMFSLGDDVLNAQLINGTAFGGFGADQQFMGNGTSSLASGLFTYTPASATPTPTVAPDTYTASLADITAAFSDVFEQAGGGVPGFEFANFNTTAFVTELQNQGATLLDANGLPTGVVADAVSVRAPGFIGNFAGGGNGVASAVTAQAVLAGFGLDTSVPADQATIAGLFGVADFNDILGVDWVADASISTPGIDAKVLYEYSLEGFDFALGYSQTGPNQAGSIAAAYTFNGLKLSAGYGMAKWDDAYTGSFTAVAQIQPGISGGLNTATATLATVTEDVKARDWNVGVSYTMDALTAAAVYQDKRFKVGNMEIDNLRTVGVSLDNSVSDSVWLADRL
jgi:hypothetical protein